ncbi:hypothetical protein CDD81_776 [Ophiocordyceps australis]|uniref:cAMP-dependent protein kinase n=1 Tax=Ophiocordyceps australis TaxID=1399860 RepID=A0A2C5Y2B9_9HYPO|nr:hypothetical protein CDD81_776 [Ophiocordyceps australis]
MPHIPSLGGFLKKRRTRDSKSDPSSTSNPTSPVAAWASHSQASSQAHPQAQASLHSPCGVGRGVGDLAASTLAAQSGAGREQQPKQQQKQQLAPAEAQQQQQGQQQQEPPQNQQQQPLEQQAPSNLAQEQQLSSTPTTTTTTSTTTTTTPLTSTQAPLAPQLQDQQQQQPASSCSARAAALSSAAPLSDSALKHQSQVSKSDAVHDETMNSATAQHGAAYAPPPPPQHHDPQNLPSINSLINHSPPHDSAVSCNPQNYHLPNPSSANYTIAASNGYLLASSSSPTSPYTAAPYTPSPGTDPSRMQQQQQHVFPRPAMQTQQQPNALHSQQQQQQSPQQLPQHSHHQHQHHGHHSHHSSQSATPRVTKGKYSLGDFEILRTLGTGSFGRVHLVQSKHNQRFYAVKVLKKAQVVKMKQVEHTNDERRMLSDVKHPFLITLWGTFQDCKNLYMVMDFVEGGELFSLLRKSGRFPNPVAKFYAAEATLALEYLHSKNIIYRDLKPENLLLDRHGHLKITDFGFAKRVPDKTWTLCGTPDYLAPEVVSNKGYNKSVDWWSLGILIYEMLCGYTPFWDSGSPMRIYENILKGKVKYPAYVNADAQNLLERLITADLTKRLGNLYGGSQDVKSHAWFAEVTWDRLARKDIDAPYTPPVKAGTGDASQFDKYPEDPEGYGVAGGSDEFGHLFSEF